MQGIAPTLRKELWPFLLGQYEWHSTREERVEARELQVDDYYRLRQQWRTVTNDQEGRFGDFTRRRVLVGALLSLKV